MHMQPQLGTEQVSLDDMLMICETEGSTLNGGGSLLHQRERGGEDCIKFIPEDLPQGRAPGGPGEIGSPIVGPAHPFGAARPFQSFSNSGF